jgi:hypothetical protein
MKCLRLLLVLFKHTRIELIEKERYMINLSFDWADKVCQRKPKLSQSFDHSSINSRRLLKLR